MYFNISADTREVEKWVKEVGTRRAQSVAATTLTSLARRVKEAAVANLDSRSTLPKVEIKKRIRVFRAKPKDLTAGLIASPYAIREGLLSPKQSGHPGRPRTSRKPAAKAQRKTRQNKGAKAPRKGGVRTRGRFISGAWVGTVRKGTAGATNVVMRRGNKAVRVFREWPVERYLRRATSVAESGWNKEYTAALKRSLARRQSKG